MPDCRQANGARSWKRPRQFLAVFPCEPVPERAGDLYAAVKLARQQRGLGLDENDLWVAATALALGATLVSRDNDFKSIDGLPNRCPRVALKHGFARHTSEETTTRSFESGSPDASAFVESNRG